MAVLHTLGIFEVYRFGDGGTLLRNNLVVVFNLGSLEEVGLHLGLAAIVNDDRNNLEYGLWMEVIGRIGDGDICVDDTGFHFEDSRIAGNENVLCLLCHFLRGATGDCSCAENGCGKKSDTFLHFV